MGCYDDDYSQWKTHPVGKKKANELGIYDMSGNLREWCEDWWDNKTKQKVIRGGSEKIVFRTCHGPYFMSWLVGFRLAEDY